MKRKTIFLICVCTVMAFLFTSCGKSAAKKDHISHQVNSNTNVSESEFSNADASVVYFTADISAEGLIKIYEQLGWQPTGKVAVKISTGEPPASNYLRPELIGDLVQQLHGTIVECNTAYGGSRSSSAMHKQVAEDHGFTAIAAFDLMDEDGEMKLPVTVPDGMKQHLKEDVVGSHFANYDDYLILSHFKGHAMAGFGGAIKNISIGIASSKGKRLIHTGGKSTSNIWGGNQTDFRLSLTFTTSAFWQVSTLWRWMRRASIWSTTRRATLLSCEESSRKTVFTRWNMPKPSDLAAVRTI